MAGTPVLRGTSDGSAAMYGCGVMIPGVASLVSGTTDVLMTRATALTRSPEEVSLTVNTCMIGGGCLVGGAMGYSGGTVSWVQTLTDKGLDELSRAAEAVAPGADGALMTPSLTGERSPFWNPDHRGAWVGIGPSHGPGHLFRACLEGSAVRTALLLKRIVGAGHSVRRLNVGGGGASSPLWNQIRADSVGLEVFVSEDPEATVRGSALLCLPHISGGAVSEKRFVEVSEKWMQPASLYTPVASRGTVYRKMAERYERTVALL
jgi:sugar (pentulose or hexulose) kinase